MSSASFQLIACHISHVKLIQISSSFIARSSRNIVRLFLTHLLEVLAMVGFLVWVLKYALHIHGQIYTRIHK